jgi:membrane protein implicated in regulation of membrane protease activity
MSVRVSPISKMAAILIIVVGAFVLLAGFVTGELASYVAGSAFLALGVALYLLLIWFTRKLRREISEIEQGQEQGQATGA